MNIVDKIFKMKGKVFYMDTDSFDTNVKLPEHMVGSKMGQLKYEGSFDKSIYLGRKQYYLMNTMSGVSKTGCKGYDSSLLSLDDWERALKNEEILVKSWQFKKENYEEIRKIDIEKVFKKSLNGRLYNVDGTTEPLELKVDIERRIRNSLADTELDIPTVRVGGYRNSKIPTLKAWTRGALEKRAIREILSNPQTLNYSIRTGELLDKGFS